MPRRREVPKRVILPDPKFHDLQIAKFINMIMRNGKKSTAEKIMYFALDNIAGKSSMGSVDLMEKAL
jgi:small subunit ribosomal protein S7